MSVVMNVVMSVKRPMRVILMSTRCAAMAALIVSAATAGAAPLPAAAKAEVTALLGRLQASSCEFNRNGDWHAAAEARAHLERKLAYLEDKNLVKTTEEFIERGASKSSMSGKPYLVRCAGAAPVESKVWLTRELTALRSASSR